MCTYSRVETCTDHSQNILPEPFGCRHHVYSALVPGALYLTTQSVCDQAPLVYQAVSCYSFMFIIRSATWLIWYTLREALLLLSEIRSSTTGVPHICWYDKRRDGKDASGGALLSLVHNIPLP